MKYVVFGILSTLSTSSFTGVSAGGMIAPNSANLSRSRLIMQDNSILLSRSRGNEVVGSSFSSGSSSSTGDRWSIGNSYGLEAFYGSDSLDFERSGNIELSDLGGASRLQGVEFQNMLGSARILEPVAYTVRVGVTPILEDYSGQVDAMFGFNFNITMIGTNITLIRESQEIDLLSSSDAYLFELSGILDPGDESGLMLFNSSSTLNAIIDEPDESVRLGYTMSLNISFATVPAPSSLFLLSAISSIGVLRRRRA
jgi:hypothetical protein